MGFIMTRDGKPVDKAPFKQLSVEQHNLQSNVYEHKLQAMMPEKVDGRFLGVKFPSLVTPRVAGVRCLTLPDGRPVDELKRNIKNLHICNTLQGYGLSGLDGVLTLEGEVTRNEVIAVVNDKHASPKFQYYVFDLWNRPQHNYNERVRSMNYIITTPYPPEIKVLLPVKVYDTGGLMKYWNKCADDGFDGIVMRQGDAHYAWWTNTMGNLKIFSKFETRTGYIIGVEEGKPGTLRGFKCLGDKGQEFSVRAGFTDKQRKFYWDTRTIQIGNLIMFNTQPGDCPPRHPVLIRVEKV